MNKNVEKVLDATVEAADSVYGAATDRLVDRMNQAGENVEKNKETAKSAIKTTIDAADKVMDAATDDIIEKLHLNEK